MFRQREKVAIVSHCILNQTTRAWWRGSGASRELGMLRDVFEILLRHGVGTVQMECPEFNQYGNPRPPRSKDGYDTPRFRERCQEIAKRTCDMIERYLDEVSDLDFSVVALVGVENSPSCGVSTVTRTVGGETVSRPGRGHLMDALDAELRKRGIKVPMIGVSLKPDEREDRLKKLEALCSHEAGA